jgi:site-specific recombinase XerD
MPKLSVVEPEVPTEVAALVDSFVADCRGRGLSLRTVEMYDATLRRVFLPWCAREGITAPAQLTGPLVGRFTTELLEQGGKRGPLSRATVRSYVRTTRGFLSWVGNPEGGASEVGASPRLPKDDRRMIDVLSRDEIQRIENVAKTERDKLIVRVFADCGIRLGELLSLRADDLREPKRNEFVLRVRGKGDKERLVPVTPALYRRLRRYIAGRQAEGREPVFAALRKGADGRYAPVAKSGVEQAIRLLGREAGLEKRVHPHLFRHSFATEWLRWGGNIISLQRILGHADLGMITSVYSHLSTSDDYAAMLSVLMAKD